MLLCFLLVQRERCWRVWPRERKENVGAGVTYGKGGVINWCPEEALWGRNQFSEEEKTWRLQHWRTELLKAGERIWRASAVALRGWGMSWFPLQEWANYWGEEEEGEKWKKCGGYRKLYKIQKINRLLGPHFQIVCLSSLYKNWVSCCLPFFPIRKMTDSSECGYSCQLLADSMFTVVFQDDFFRPILFLWSRRLLWGETKKTKWKQKTPTN